MHDQTNSTAPDTFLSTANLESAESKLGGNVSRLIVSRLAESSLGPRSFAWFHVPWLRGTSFFKATNVFS